MQLPGVPSLLGLYLLFVLKKHSPMETRLISSPDLQNTQVPKRML